MKDNRDQVLQLLLDKIEDVIEKNRVLIINRGMLGDKPKRSKHGNYMTIYALRKELSKKQLRKIIYT